VLLLAILATLLSTVAAPPRAQAAPQPTALAEPMWKTVGPINLAETHGMTYVSQSDPRWGQQFMSSIPNKTYDACACILAGIASLLNYQFPLPGDTTPIFPVPIQSVPDPDVPLTEWDLLWSPNYLDNLFKQRGLYDNIGKCGTLPTPWAASNAGDPTMILNGDGTVLGKAPTGIMLNDLDLADYTGGKRNPWPGQFNDAAKNLVVGQLLLGRPVMIGRRTPVGGNHVYLIVGINSNHHFIAFNVGWRPGRPPIEALMFKEGETYEEWENSITDVWTYEQTTGTPVYLDWSSGGSGSAALTSSGAPAATFELAMTTPDGRRIGFDPATGQRLVSAGSYSAGRFEPADAVTGLSEPSPPGAPVRHLYVRDPAAGRFFAEVIATDGAGSVQTTFRDSSGTHLADLDVDVPADGTAKVELVRAADGSVTTTPVDQFGPQAVVEGPTSAAAGQDLEFDALESFDADGSIESYDWDFGDGTTVPDDRIVTHAFDAPGTYDVRLTVTDDDGAERTVTHEVTVARSDDLNPEVTIAGQGGAWQQQPFDVTVTGTDSGRGVRTTTYEATGATTVPATTVDGGGPATVRVTAEGRTTVTAQAVDRDGNHSPVRTVDVGVDTAAPTSTVTTPAPGGQTAGLGIVAGSTSDATSGAAAVDVALRRSDGSFWTGSGWATTETWLPASMGSVAGDRWYIPAGLPSGTDLPRGTYTLRSRATDRAGNVEAPGAGTTFEVTGSALPTAVPVELDVPAGSSPSLESVDDDGTVVGRLNSTQQAVRWNPDGTRTTLPPLPGDLYGWARDITAGVVVGDSSGTGGTQRAVLWRDGAPVDLGVLAPGRRAGAYSVDASGTAVGFAHDDQNRERPVRFTATGPQMLPSLPGVAVQEGSARAISPNGRFVAGIAKTATGASVTVRWDGATPTVLTGAFGVPSSVNDSGAVTATATVSGLHAVVWEADGTLRDLGPGSAADVDERGTVVGSAVALGGNVAGDAAWWQGGGRSLFTDVLPAGSPWRLINANAVSDTTGIVIGSGRNGDRGGYWRMEVPALLEDRDVSPPTVTVSPDGAGWHTGDVTLTVQAADTGSGVASVRTSVTGDVAGDRVDVPVTAEGETTVAYAATDVAGNTAAARTTTVRIDRTAPAVSLRRIGPAGPWSQSDVTVVMTGTDALSGMAELRYRVDGGPEQRVPNAVGGVTVSVDGVHTVSVVAVDRAGNVAEPVVTEVRIDRTAPTPRVDVLTGASRPTGALASATDAVSGVATTTLRHVVDGVDVPVEGLQAALSAPGAHRLVVGATDAAGNSAERTLDVAVPTVPGVAEEPVSALPVADAGGPYRVAAGRALALDGSRSTSASGGPLAHAWSVSGIGTVEGERPEVSWARPGTYLVTLEVRDGDHWSRSEPGDGSRALVEVYDPATQVTADAGPDQGGEEGSTLSLAGVVSDGATPMWSAEPISAGEGTCRIADPGIAATTAICDDEGTWQFTLTATSEDGSVAVSDTLVAVVANASPKVVADVPDEVVLGSPVGVTAAVSDRGSLDVLTCRVTWPDGTTETVAVRGGLCTTSRVLDAVGPQRVQVAVTDEDGGLGLAEETVAVRYAVVLPEGGTMNAGRAIPITFGLGGYRGMDVLTEAVSVRLDAAGEPIGAETPGNSALSWSAGTQKYHWNWDTAKAWGGQTRALILRFDDGSEHRVVYRFR
jgi:PKD repeat protein